MNRAAVSSKASTCEQALGRLVENVGGAADVCGPDGDAECERIARKAAQDVVDNLKNVDIRVQVRGDSATAGPAAGPEGFDGQLRKIDGRWLMTEFASP